MRRPFKSVALLAIILSLAAGCGSKLGTAKFDSEREEHAYLSSLSNPTPEQWKRKNELTEKIARESLESSRRAEAAFAAEWNAPAAVAQRAKEEAERNSAAIKELMESGAEKEGKGEPGLACFYYRSIIDKFPNAPEADTARERLKLCRKIAYGLEDGQ